MKVLIMVLSCVKHPYDRLLKAQKETWDSIPHKHCETVYYYGGNRLEFNDRELMLPVSDGYYEMHWKFKLALDYVWDMKWDYIFRTNSSTYVNKEGIYNYIKANKPKYAGIINGNYITGPGIILNRKTAGILKDQLKENTGIEYPNEDMVIGDVLRANKIEPEYGANMSTFSKDSFEVADYYRCKTATSDGNRSGDIEAFNFILNHLKK